MSLVTRLPALETVAARWSGGRAGAPGGAGPSRVNPRLLTWGGVVLSLVIAGVLFSRFSIDDTLRRDESIYTYGGQQLTHGVPVYVSIFDPKTPLAAMLAGLGAALAHAFGADDVHTIRILFFVFSCLTAGAVYLLAYRLWRSPLAGLVSAVVFVSFRGFALDALGGPDAKTPGIFLGVLAMALLVRERWFWGAFAGALAALAWQPLVVYVAVAVLGAAVSSERGARRRGAAHAALGAAVPVAAVLLYFTVSGALPEFIEAAVRFPLVGVRRGHEAVGQRLDVIAGVVQGYYGRTRVLFWGGLALLLAGAVLRLVEGRHSLRAALTHPYTSVVVLSLLGLAAFSARDFQGYPDLYPLLPYAALGIGETVHVVRGRLNARWLRGATAAGALACVAVLVAVTWSWYSIASPRDTALVRERAAIGRLERLLDPGEGLYAFGDPTPLVLAERRNPSRYIYLGSGVARWAVHHSFGSFAGWTAHVRAAHPAVITLSGWDANDRWEIRMTRWLHAHYAERAVGRWSVFLRPGVAARAARRGIRLRAGPPVGD